MPTINVNLTLSYDTRGVASLTQMQNGKDQRRVNCHYEITRTAVDTQPDIALARRPGVTVDANSYGATTQGLYLVGKDPASTWDPTPFSIVKDGSANKVCSTNTSVTLLSDATYYPRFVDYTNISGTNYAVVQLQNKASPATSPSQRIFYASTINGWSEMTLNGIAARGKAEHLNGYCFLMDGNNHTIIQSSLDSLAQMVTSDVITMSSTANPVQGLIKHGSRLIAFTTNNCEIFKDASNTTNSTLDRVVNSESEIGLSSLVGNTTSMDGKTNYYCRIGELTFFVGRYGGAKFDSSLIAFDGSRFIKISKPYEDTLLSNTTIYSVNSMSFGGKVAVAIQTTAPTATTQRWLMFFPDINEWFEWESTVFSPVNNGFHFAGAGSGLTNKLYYFPNADKWNDSGVNFTMTAQFRLPFPDLTWKRMFKCGVIADTLSSSQNLAVSFSNDDCANFTTARNIDLSTSRKELRRLGTFRERFVRLTHADTGELRLRRFYADVQ